MCSAVLFILMSRLLVYSGRSGMTRVHVILSVFSVKLFCFVQAKTLYKYCCMYLFSSFVLVGVNVMEIASA